MITLVKHDPHLESLVSTEIARMSPLENTPELRAMLHGSGVISAPWGHFASTMIEMHEGLDPQDAIRLLGISASQLRDHTGQFEDVRQYYEYRGARQEGLFGEIKQELDEEVKRLEQEASSIMLTFEIADSDSSDRQAAVLQAEIEEASTTFKSLLNPADEEVRSYNVQQFLRVTKRDALESGYAGTLADFLKLALSTSITGKDGSESRTEDINEESQNEEIESEKSNFNDKAVSALFERDFAVEPSQLSTVWLKAIRYAMDSLVQEYVSGNVSLGRGGSEEEFQVFCSQLIIGKDFFESFILGLDDTYDIASRRSEAIWNTYFKPVFESGRLKDHSLVTGKNIR